MDVNSRDPLQNIIPFRIKGTEIGRFDSSGNLKIGTTTTTAPTVRLDISGGAARVNSGAATSTALTTTGRIGVNTATPTVDLDVTGAARMSALSATATALTTTGRIGVNTAFPAAPLDVNGNAIMRNSVRIGSTAAPGAELDVTGIANVSNYLSVGSGGSGSGTTTSTLPNAFYVRTGGSNWRDFIPLLVANSTTNIIIWGGPDSQWLDVNYGPENEIAKQYSYFAAYWLNANRAVVGTSFTVESFAGTGNNPPTSSRGLFTFRATAVTNGLVTSYDGQLSAFDNYYYGLTPQQDGIDAGVARRSLSNPNRTLLMGGSVETGYLGVTGAAKIAGELNMNSNKIVNLTTPTAAADAANKSYVDTKTTDVATTAFVTGNTWVNNPNVTRVDNLNNDIYITGVLAPPLDNTADRRSLYMDSNLYYNPYTNTLTSGTFSGTLSGNATSALSAANISNPHAQATFTMSGSERMRITADGKVGIGTTSPSVALDVNGNAAISGSMTISGCKPRSSITYTSNFLRTDYSIPSALRGGDFITNKVYFSIRVLAGPRNLFLKPNGSATTFHSFMQQTIGSSIFSNGFDDTTGFRMCEIIGGSAGGGYTVPILTHIVGEFTIIRNTVIDTSTTNNGLPATRIYGNLVQYGNHYIQKWDFQGQALNGGAHDYYDRIDFFKFLTSDATKDANVLTTVAVTIEG